jgi:RimJ/RimL family protein N-acetyltransferase
MASIRPKTFTDRTGQEFVIRTAQPDDAETLLAYIRPVAEETEFFVIEPDEFPSTVEEEQAWIHDHLDSPSKIILLAESSKTIIGSVTFEAGNFRRISHRGNLGLAVVEAWRRRGVGTALLRALLKWAESNPALEKVCLDVFAINEPAIRIYRQFGFIEEGRRLKDIKRGLDDYVDTVTMYRFV